MDQRRLDDVIQECSDRFESGRNSRSSESLRRLVASLLVALLLVLLIFKSGLDHVLVGFFAVFLFGFAIAFAYGKQNKARNSAIDDFCQRLAALCSLTFEPKPKSPPAELRWLVSTDLAPAWDKMECHHVFSGKSGGIGFEFGHLKLVRDTTPIGSGDTIRSFETTFEGTFVQFCGLPKAAGAAWLEASDDGSRRVGHDVWTRNPGADIRIDHGNLKGFTSKSDAEAPVLAALCGASPTVSELLSRARLVTQNDDVLFLLAPGGGVSPASLSGDLKSDLTRLAQDVLAFEAGCTALCELLNA